LILKDNETGTICTDCTVTPARQFASELVFDQTVIVQVHDTNRYGRLVGEVMLPDG